MKKIKKTALLCIYNSKKNKILLQERGDYSKVGEEWAFFGGGIESNETHLEAFIRESKEELDLDVTKIDYKYMGEFNVEFSDIITYRYLYYIETDLEESDFTVLEGAGAKYFTTIEARKLKFPAPAGKLMDIIDEFILGREK